MIDVNLNFSILFFCIIIPIFCLIITLYFIFKKVSNRSNVSTVNNANCKQNNFEDEINIHVICQQLDTFLVKTLDEIEKNRNLLKQYSNKKGKKKIKNIVPTSAKDNFYVDKLLIKSNISETIIGDGQNTNINEIRTSPNPIERNFNHISELLQSGLTSKQISERTKIPQSEVDLYIKLHLKDNQNLTNPVSLFRLSV